jgi:formylglycine-generating enzyme required for sulfatase activity
VDQNFVSILEKLIKERGKEVLLDKSKCKAFLADYTRNEYKKESDLLFLAIEAGSAKVINDTEELKICKLQQIKKLQKEKFLASEFSIDIVDTLALVLRGSTIKTVPSGFVLINGGAFLMGSPSDEPERSDHEGPQHKVFISPFCIGKYQVTQIEYQTVMGNNPSHFSGNNLPVELVSWYDAVEYCNRLSQNEKLTSAYIRNGDNVKWNINANGYRLPTEAEWEYACRAGTTTPFNTGDNINSSQANYNGKIPYSINKSVGEYRVKTTSVGNFGPNSWNLYDMHGNVWEWCWDWYGAYSSEEQIDPQGASSGFYRVIRGGGWNYLATNLRSASRFYYDPSLKEFSIGFRLVRS